MEYIFATPIGRAISLLYGLAEHGNAYMDRHIDALKASDVASIAATGRVLAAAKTGFGLGYTSSIVLIAAGQMLLGNTLAAAGTVASGVTGLAVATNPIAMTCAAVGAIYYGWNALSATEQDALLQRLADGVKAGVELIRSMIVFLISSLKSLLEPEQLRQLKRYVQEQAAGFGRSLFDVTQSAGDFIQVTAQHLNAQAQQFANATESQWQSLKTKAITKIKNNPIQEHPHENRHPPR